MSTHLFSQFRTPVQYWNDRLGRPLKTLWLTLGWIVVSILFILTIWLLKGPTVRDSDVTVFTAWSLAHGHLACAYLPQGIMGYPPTAPLYPLFSSAVLALFQIGHGLPFPSSAQLGPHCVSATSVIYQWSFHSGAVTPTLRVGLFGWFVLAGGYIALLRASGKGRRGWELIGLALLACLPPVSMCLAEYFHPQDLIAVGMILAGLAFAIRDRWLWTGILLGLAISTQQFAILVFVPLFAMTPKKHVLQMTLATIATVAIIDIPIAVLSSGRAIVGILVGTGASSYEGTWLDFLHLHGSALYLVSRALPILLALALGWWAADRLGPNVLRPVPLVAVIATALSLRLIFEVNFWGYYMMAVAVMLAALDIVRGRVRWSFLIWLVAILVASLSGGLTNSPSHSSVPVWLWQVIFVPSALALALSPLISMTREVKRSPALH